MIVILYGHNMGGEPETFELNIRKAYLDDTGELVVEVDDV